MVDKIVIKNNKLYSETNLNGYKDYSLIREFIPILEQFIESHPSFSINNAKGIINLTGYDGILGYRTQSSNTQSKSEIKKAKPVVNKLKQNGWTFACHSYGHYHMNKITNEKFAIELEKWKKEVEPIVGKTEIYVYPYGEWSVYDSQGKTYKHKLLENYGFKIFCGVGMQTFYNYLPSKNNQKVLFMDRKVIDGITLKRNDSRLIPFFNPSDVLDKKTRQLR